MCPEGEFVVDAGHFRIKCLHSVEAGRIFGADTYMIFDVMRITALEAETPARTGLISIPVHIAVRRILGSAAVNFSALGTIVNRNYGAAGNAEVDGSYVVVAVVSEKRNEGICLQHEADCGSCQYIANGIGAEGLALVTCDGHMIVSAFPFAGADLKPYLEVFSNAVERTARDIGIPVGCLADVDRLFGQGVSADATIEAQLKAAELLVGLSRKAQG